MVDPAFDESPGPECHFDASSILAAIEQIAGQMETLRTNLAAMDQKITQMRGVDQQNIVQTVKQVRSALDLSTRDNKQALEALEVSVRAATVRIRSLDLALSNRKLEELAARTAGHKPSKQPTPDTQEEPSDG